MGSYYFVNPKSKKLIKGEEAVAAVDDIGQDDEATKIDFFAIPVR